MRPSFIYLAILCLFSTTVSPASTVPYHPSNPLRQAVLAHAQKQILEAETLDIFVEALMVVAGCFPTEMQFMSTEEDFCMTVDFLNTFLESASNKLYKSDETVTAAFYVNEDYKAPYLYLLWMRNTIVAQELLRYPLPPGDSERKDLLRSHRAFFIDPTPERSHSLSNASSAEPSPPSPPARTLMPTKSVPPVTDAVVSHSPKATRAF